MMMIGSNKLELRYTAHTSLRTRFEKCIPAALPRAVRVRVHRCIAFGELTLQRMRWSVFDSVVNPSDAIRPGRL